MRVSLTGGSPEMVKNIYPGTTNNYQNLSSPRNLKAVNNTLYFNADNGANGRELWKSDGTNAGTVLVADLNPAGSSTPVPLVGINGVLYFTADNGSAGRELWKYDPNSGPGGTTTLRINAGGGAYTASGSRSFSEDNYFTGGTSFSNSGVDIANTTDDELFRSERYGNFAYNLPVTNGSYKLSCTLPKSTLAVWPAGEPVRVSSTWTWKGHANLLISIFFAEAGGALTAIQKTYTVAVTDGTLNLNFITGSANNPKVSAIEVVPNPTLATRINAGGAEYVGSGTRFSADTQFSGGAVFSNRSVDIDNTTDDELYRTERYGNFAYSLPVTNGSYHRYAALCRNLLWEHSYWGSRITKIQRRRGRQP